MATRLYGLLKKTDRRRRDLFETLGAHNGTYVRLATASGKDARKSSWPMGATARHLPADRASEGQRPVAIGEVRHERTLMEPLLDGVALILEPVVFVPLRRAP